MSKTDPRSYKPTQIHLQQEVGRAANRHIELYSRLKFIASLDDGGIRTYLLEKGASQREQYYQRMASDLMAANKLCQLMRDEGYKCTANEVAVMQLLTPLPQQSETDVAEALSFMVQTMPNHDEQPPNWDISRSDTNSWNFGVFVSILKLKNKNLNWALIAEKLDNERFFVNSFQAFASFVAAFKDVLPGGLPLGAVVGRVWKHGAGQLSFLRFAVNAVPELFTFEHAERKLAPVEGLQGSNRLPSGSPNHAWLSLDLLETLAGLIEHGQLAAVRAVLENPMKQCPEVLLLSVAAVRSKLGVLEREVSSALLPLYLASNPNSPIVLHRLWGLNKEMLISGMVDWFNSDNSHTSRILDLCQDLKALTTVLDSTPYPFALELAALASRREYLNLEKWLNNRLTQDGLPFLQASLEFLEKKTRPSVEGPAPGQPGGRIMISADTCCLFLQVLIARTGSLSPEFREELDRLKTQAMAMHPKLQALLEATPAEGFAPDIEAEANSYFQKLYAGEIGVDQVVQMLKKFKVSSSPREQEVLACMIHNLFDEYRFFPRYPDLELGITAKLFGALLHEQLVSSIPLSIALRYILEALRNPPNSKMFKFGYDAVKQFKTDLHLWPQFCSHVVSVCSHIQEVDPALFRFLEQIMREGLPGATGELSGSMGSEAGLVPSAQGTATAGESSLPASGGDIGGESQQVPGGIRATASTSGVSAMQAIFKLEDVAEDKGEMGEGPKPAVAPPPTSMPPSTGAATTVVNGGPAPALGAGLSSSGLTDTSAANLQVGPPADGPQDLQTELGSMEGTEYCSGMMGGNAREMVTQVVQDVPSLASVVTADTLESAEEEFLKEVREPGGQVQDKVSFIINNVTPGNMSQKIEELKKLILPDFLEWFANYLVIKRAIQEPNHHHTYIQLMDMLGDRRIFDVVLKATFHYSKVLLYNDRSTANERALLKNIGAWLGLLTFARKKVINYKDMDLKEVIVDAYKGGRLTSVLPFVQKVLEGCKDSKIFTIKNPLIESYLGLMSEIANMDRVRSAVEWAVELTFKTFTSTSAKAPGCPIKPTDQLKDMPRLQVCNQDFFPPAIDNSSVVVAISPNQPQPALRPTAPPTSQPAAYPQPTPAPQAAAPQVPATMAGPPPAVPAAIIGPSTTPAPPASQPSAQRPITPSMPANGAAVRLAVSPEVTAPQPPSSAPPAAQTPAAVLTQQPGMDSPAMFANLHAYVTISPNLVPLANRVDLKRMVPVAVDRAIGDIITPVVERSVTIACMTTYELVLKDFAVDPDDQRMKKCAHQMVSSLSGSMALVTCKEPLRVSLTNQLKQMLTGIVEGQILDQAVQLLVNDNLELGCNLIEKSATEKAVRDIDKSLQSAYEQRQKAKATGAPWADFLVYQQQGRFPASLPDSLKPKANFAPQLRVYEEFTRIPKTAPPALSRGMGGPGGAPGEIMGDKPDAGGPAAAPVLGAALVEKYMMWQQTLDSALMRADPSATSIQEGTELHQVLEKMSELLVQPNLEEGRSFLAKRLVKRLFEGSISKLQVAFHITALKLLFGMGYKRLPTEIPGLWAAVQEDCRFKVDILEALIRHRLVSYPEFDSIISRDLLVPQYQKGVVDLALLLCKLCQEGVLNYQDMYNSLESTQQLLKSFPSGSQLVKILEDTRSSARVRAPSGGEPRDRTPDPEGFRDQIIRILEDWAHLLTNQSGDKVQHQFVLGLKNRGLLKMDELTEKFIRILVEVASVHCLNTLDLAARSANTTPEPLQLFLAIDPLVKLIVCVTTSPQGSDMFLIKALQVLVSHIKRSADEKIQLFNGRPYIRLYAGLITELTPADVNDAVGQRYVRAIGLSLLSLQPSSVPGFAFAWLELISHRAFMPKILMAPQQQGWPLFEALLVALLKFLEPHLRAVEVKESVRVMYKGTLRLLLVLLHDFPEFLCEHYFQLCDVIPTCCIQMRNLILSAFPRVMRLPDPFTPNLKVDTLPEISTPPIIVPDPDQLLPPEIKSQVDKYLSTGQPTNTATEIVKLLKAKKTQDGVSGVSSTYHVPLLNAIVLYVGSQNRPGSVVTTTTPAMELFQRLAAELDSEGRYLLLNSLANQLRYPNSHTHYFSCVLLTLFAEAEQEVLQEQITRVLLERLIVNRPHPWGLLVTFIELIKNPRYNFWQHSFTRIAPEIERLFESVARSCMGPTKTEEESVLQKEAVRA